MQARILVVEDEADLAELVSFNLQQAHYAVETFEDAEQALVAIHERLPDLVILDVMLPGVSGTELCRQLRRDPSTESVPVLMLTARREEVDRVVGFEVGADDYMTKPFSPRELVLRVGAILRRTQRPSVPEAQRLLRIGELVIDVPRHEVRVADAPVAVTPLEFRLLLDLASRQGVVQSRDALLERVWGYTAGMETRTVDTHVKRLREKLGQASECIETVRGVGYRMREPAA